MSLFIKYNIIAQNLSKKIDKEEEEAKLKQLLQDDFIDDGDYNDSSLLPIQLPKQTKSGAFIKEEVEIEPQKPKLKVLSPTKLFGDGVISMISHLCSNYTFLHFFLFYNQIVKQEVTDDSEQPEEAKASSYQRRKLQSQIEAVDLFEHDGDLLFFQVNNYHIYFKFCLDVFQFKTKKCSYLMCCPVSKQTKKKNDRI